MSLHVWAEPIKNKSASTIRRVLTSIFDSITHPIKEVTSISNAIQEVATDQGTTLVYYNSSIVVLHYNYFNEHY